MRESRVLFDRSSCSFIKGAMANAGTKLDAKNLEQTAYFVLQINTLSQQRLAARQHGSDIMALEALDMNFTIPAGTQDLCNASRVVAVGLIAHGAKRCFHMPCFHNDRAKACIAKSIDQPLRQCSGLKADRPTVIEMTPRMLKD